MQRRGQSPSSSSFSLPRLNLIKSFLEHLTYSDFRFPLCSKTSLSQMSGWPNGFQPSPRPHAPVNVGAYHPPILVPQPQRPLRFGPAFGFRNNHLPNSAFHQPVNGQPYTSPQPSPSRFVRSNAPFPFQPSW